mmetsp:Transcript_20316/g.34922  ORF Transcript_20316/g.34922 Transcript_20316/m.34922 type:complete len:407 (+) Transcript_20316:97-1317(+)
MCLVTMVNDGGLSNVLRTADRVSNGLCSLNANGAGAHQGSDSASGVKRKPSRSLSEISSKSDQSVRMDLGQHTSKELREAVAPLIRSLEKLDAPALLSLNASKNGRGAIVDPHRGITVPPIHDRITPSYPKNDSPNIVRYLHVKEVPHKYSVGIFVFPPNTEIPLHDHPGMVVISRVLYGVLQVQSFDVIPENANSTDHDDNSDHKKSCNDTPANSFTSRPPSSIRSSFNKIKSFVSRAISSPDGEAETRADSVLRVKPNLKPMGVQDPSIDGGNANSRPPVLSAPSVTCLYPHEGNCHSFMAGPDGAAVIDVLLPPYDNDEDRDCTFYAHEDPDHHLMNGKDSSQTLTPIEQPDDFHCLGGTYGRFGKCDEYCVTDTEEPEEDDDHDMNGHVRNGHNMIATCSLS